MYKFRHVGPILLLTSLLVSTLPGCLTTDDEGGNSQPDFSADTGRDDSINNDPNTDSGVWPPEDLGRPDTVTDTSTDTGEDDGTTVEDLGSDTGTDTGNDTGSGDPLSCSLVDYGYGPVWDGTVSSASTGTEPSPMTGITEAHNAVRRFVGLADLTWSSSLASSAQTWADDLAGSQDCNLIHDPDNDSQGENLYSYYTTGTLNVTPQEVMGGWACEREDWDNTARTCQGVSGFSGSSRACGHYTQVVWDDTTQVGCATATCVVDGFNAMVWVCRYSPPGNWVGERPYDE